MQPASSRSHAIFTLKVQSELIKDGITYICNGKLNLVDLAGSERIYKSNNSKNMIKEAKSINLSLHYLEQVLISLKDARDQAALHQKVATSTARRAQQVLTHQNNYRLSMESASSSGTLSLAQSTDTFQSENFSAHVAQSSSSVTSQSNPLTSRVHIPYRNSVLTSILRDSLGGNCRSCFLLTMSTIKANFEESISTCR